MSTLLAYTPIVASWIKQCDKDVDYLVDEARSAAEEFVRLGMVYVEVEPGDMTSYKMFLVDLDKHAAESGDNDGHDGRAYGGNLLVTLVSASRGGAAYVLQVNGFHVPSYVGQKLALDPHSAAVVAAFLTLFSAAVVEARA